jgi:NADPH:quinone reductase-like Zn-dependent oxidoreductase
MKAIVQDRYGTPEVLELREVGLPEPGEGEVMIRVRAASLNVYDTHMTTGMPYLARVVAGWGKPKNGIPGADVAGVVEEVGAGVSRFRPGDEVFGDIGAGAFAEYAVTSEQKIARKPPSLSFEEAAALPLAGITALQGLRDLGGLRPGQRVIINGASGGVGTFAVQIAKALGARVTAVCSTSKVDMVRSIGADEVIDYTRHDYTRTERGYDLLFDNVGDRGWWSTRRVLAPSGRNVAITGPKHALMGPFRRFVFRKVMSMFDSRSFTWLTAHVSVDDLVLLAELANEGKVVPVIENRLPLEKTPDALRYLSAGHALGKLIITT